MEEKVCVRCKESKPLTEFSKDRRNKDGLNKYCRACKKFYNDAQKEYRKNACGKDDSSRSGKDIDVTAYRRSLSSLRKRWRYGQKR